MDQAGAEIAAARFQQALLFADDARARLEPKPDVGARQERQVQVEILSATALVALGRSEEAAENFARALNMKPDLKLDEQTTPPKILRLFTQVRDGRSALGEPGVNP